MKRDIYQEITTAILEALQAGVRPWKQCYTTSLPLRTTGDQYKGINCLRLMLEAERKGYLSPHWMTFQQATERGGYVRKGEKSTLVCFFKTFEKDDPDSEEGTVKIPVARAYHVFNLEQLEGVGQDTLGEKPTIITETSRFFASLPGKVVETTQTPAYSPTKDQIRMPGIERFSSAEAYYATLGHEYIHWTGHESRLQRNAERSRAGYAFEELVAELGAAFLLPQIGLQPLIDDEHAPYIAHYVKMLEDDHKAIFRASTLAQRATDYLIGLASPVLTRESA